MKSGVRGRLAPSPTGYLHLGNAWAFLWAWLACRKAGGELVLRMEDIDGERSSDTFKAALIADLRWRVLDSDEGPDVVCSCGPYEQSARFSLYEEALGRLESLGRVYRCYCTRKELRDQLRHLAGAPHVDDRGAPYAGTCRHLSAEERTLREAAGRRPCLRMNTEGLVPLLFSDAVCGAQSLGLEDCGGDFALRRSDGVWAYQLAVVVDDGLMKINQVVRGEDILVSTPRQLALFDLLGLPRPSYAHVPLLCDANGERLAKRHNSLALRALRSAGWTARELTGILAWKGRIIPELRPVSPAELIPFFAWDTLPEGLVRLDMPEHHSSDVLRKIS